MRAGAKRKRWQESGLTQLADLAQAAFDNGVGQSGEHSEAAAVCRRRLRVRNHGAVVGAPVPPRIVSAFAALETRRMLITRGCRDDSVRAPGAEAIPTRMCGDKGNRVRGQSPAENRSRSQNDHDLAKHQKHSFCHASLA
jgi:hypothetical protein